MNGLTQDAITLCTAILNSLSPYDVWAIVNIARSDKRAFTYRAIPEIPSSYGYSYDKVPQILQEDGVTEASVKGKWFVDIGVSSKQSYPIYDLMTPVARAKGYLTSKQYVSYYSRWTRDYYDEGPREPGQYAVLINRAKLIQFIRWYSGNWPKYQEATGELEYLGHKITFDGDLKKKTMALLMQNINSIVPKNDLYNIRAGGAYERLAKAKRTTQINDATDKIIEELKKQLKGHDVLSKRLIIASWNGYGLFINNAKTPSTSQKSE